MRPLVVRRTKGEGYPMVHGMTLVLTVFIGTILGRFEALSITLLCLQTIVEPFDPLSE